MGYDTLAHSSFEKAKRIPEYTTYGDQDNAM
jgi:hypothetical protein